MENTVLESERFIPNNVNPWSTAITYGFIGGIAFMVFYIANHLFGFNDPELAIEGGGNVGLKWTLTLLSWIVSTFIYVKCISKHREDLGGFITYGQAFVVSFFSVLIKALIAGIFSYIMLKFIFPNQLSESLDITLAVMEEQGSGDPEEMRPILEGWMTPFIIGFLVVSIVTVIGGAILSLLAAAIGQRENPYQ